MQAPSLKKIDGQIERIKAQLLALGPMRPGTLSRQYRNPRQRQGAFWQISYTHQMKSRSEYVRANEVAAVRQEIARFRRYKKLTTRWVELALWRSQTRLKQIREGTNVGLGETKNGLKTTKSSDDAPNIRVPD